MDQDFEHLRADIDAIDLEILRLVQARARIVGQVWAWKRAHGVARQDPERERQLLARLQAANAGSGLPAEVVAAVFRAVIGAQVEPG